MRDIEKDKAWLKPLTNSMFSRWIVQAALHWIAQYEAAQTRISELEEKLELRNRPDVYGRPSHDIALEQIFGEMEGMKK